MVEIKQSFEKALDTRVNTARTLVSAAGLLAAGLSFFVFQYLDAEQMTLKCAASICLLMICFAAQQCIRVTIVASVMYHDGESNGVKPSEATSDPTNQPTNYPKKDRYSKIERMLSCSSWLMVGGFVAFAALVAYTLSFDKHEQSKAEAFAIQNQKMTYECAVDYGPEGSRTATMNCTRTPEEN